MTVWPTDAAHIITQAFGARPEVYAQYGFPGHEGVDLRATLDAPVRAVADGAIAVISTSGNYGNCIRITHADGWQTTYAHLNRFAGQVYNQQVKAGDVIGYAGTTGNSTGVHLHFGLKHLGHTYTDDKGTVWPYSIFDPTPYLTPLIPLPPASTGIDLLPYLKGDGRIYQMTVVWKGQRQGQQVQTQITNTRFYQVKNSEWEELWSDAQFIYRGIDTSPGNDLYYTQRQDALTYGARWCRRFMAAGDLYERNPLVTFYEKATGAEVPTPARGYHRTWLKFVAYHPTWKAVEGLMFNDVVELHWLLRPDSQVAEKYFYARNYGLIGWSSSGGDYSFVTEVFRPGERQPMTRESVVVR